MTVYVCTYNMCNWSYIRNHICKSGSIQRTFARNEIPLYIVQNANSFDFDQKKGWVLVAAADADVALLAPPCTPAVLHDPVRDALLLPEPHDQHDGGPVPSRIKDVFETLARLALKSVGTIRANTTQSERCLGKKNSCRHQTPSP